MSEIEFNVLLRKPRYPVIVVSGDRLYSASTVKQLGMACVGAIPVGAEKKRIVVIDANGEEFWYSTEHYALMPGLMLKKWTKKRIIETYNNSLNSALDEQGYPLKGLSGKKLEVIIKDICQLLKQ